MHAPDCKSCFVYLQPCGDDVDCAELGTGYTCRRDYCRPGKRNKSSEEVDESNSVESEEAEEPVNIDP